jgi:hypothetical protein
MLELQQLKKYLEDFQCLCESRNILFNGEHCHIVVMENGEEHQNQAEFIKPYRGYSAIYIFWLVEKDICLKVGRAGENSDARLRSHHYCAQKRADSALSKSILNDKKRPYDIPNQCIANRLTCLLDDCPKKANDTPNQCIGDWIKNNTQKVIYFLARGTSELARSSFEGYLQSVLHPMYEGRRV